MSDDAATRAAERVALLREAEARGMIGRPIEVIGTSSTWLRDRLRAEEVRIHPEARVARSLARLGELREGALRGDTFKFTSTDLAYDFVADAIGADFLSKALHAGWDAGFRFPRDRWLKLASGDPIVTKVGARSTERNLTWELLIANLAATFSKDVRLEEPDVSCTYEGAKVAIAAKVVYSERKLLENIEEGFAQANGRGDVSIVFVDVVELYPIVGQLRYSRARRFSDNDHAVDTMKAAFTRWCDRFALKATVEKMRARAKRPAGVVFFVPMFLEMLGMPRPFFYVHVPITWGHDTLDFRFATSFLRACNTTLGYAAQVARSSS